MKIDDRIENIVAEKGSSIIILKGIDFKELPTSKKYFPFTLSNLDKADLKSLRTTVVNVIIENRKFDQDYKWMTIEEYQLFKENAVINQMPVILLENNLYEKQFPYRGTLSNVENIYQYLYYQEDNELSQEQQKLLETVSVFYGQIDYSKQSGRYFVTYPTIDQDIPKYFLHEEKKIDVQIATICPTQNFMQIELSDDEIPFLDLEEDILINHNEPNLIFVLAGSIESLPNKYLERLNILNNLKNINSFFTILSIKRQFIENESKYKELLNAVYGFPDFREIEFYKDIESHSKEVIKISQAQIIDDIVNQAEKAMQGESFRDIFITSSTSSGKSIMFQLPALYLAEKYKENKPLTLVISPLIGLMNDQVSSMREKGIYSSATINGSTPPFEKERILEKIRDQEMDVLYLSPESLQARSDIKLLIGDRNIGVVIIDEAHIVTTWGKSFRADYWYLGIYLAKLRKEYKFPIVTFTATAIFGGREDMYLDTRNSLNMISPISYFGKVRRDDIWMNVRSSDRTFKTEGRDYRKTKNVLALTHLQNAYKSKQKTLVYFPTVRLLLDFYNFVFQNDPLIAEKTGKFYGGLQKEEKDEVLSEFKSGDMQFVLATKAFGMGIDIKDITNVYHYAPTGNVVDYVQEIGRAARDKDKVSHGFGLIDFLDYDMNEVKQLYGMSAIRKTQIIEVMRKVLAVYKEKGNNRNLIISPEDFKYIFVQNKRDEDSLENKVKTVLLMIEKDFSSPNKIGYSPFVARPRTLFGNDLIFVSSSFENEICKSKLNGFFEKVKEIQSKTYTSIYKVNLSGIWEKFYRKISYPSFKHALFTAEEREGLRHKELFEKFVFASAITVTPNQDTSIDNILSQYRRFLDSFERFANEQKIDGNQFTVTDLGSFFMRDLKIADKFEARAFAQTMINSAFEFTKLKNIKFIAERPNSSDDNQRYILFQDSDIYSSFIMSSITNCLKPSENFYVDDTSITSLNHRTVGIEIDSKLAALGIGESRKLLSYTVSGGNDPQIYLRMNSVYPIERAIKQGDFYQNSILQDVQFKHYISVEMLKYLFTKEQPEKTAKERIYNYTHWFWDNIEDYFMGIMPSEVKDSLIKNK